MRWGRNNDQGFAFVATRLIPQKMLTISLNEFLLGPFRGNGIDEIAAKEVYNKFCGS
jgi:hypothetical protein